MVNFVFGFACVIFVLIICSYSKEIYYINKFSKRIKMINQSYDDIISFCQESKLEFIVFHKNTKIVVKKNEIKLDLISDLETKLLTLSEDSKKVEKSIFFDFNLQKQKHEIFEKIKEVEKLKTQFT